MANGLSSSVPRDPVRAALAARYIRGEGVEFGALHAGLEVPADVRVRYADLADGDALHAAFTDLGAIRRPDLISDLETMAGIEPDSLDFLIANHVLEHTQNPLRALKSIAARLKPGGIAYMALPDKLQSFDFPRPVTPLSHLLRDETEGPEWSRDGHYEEWTALVDGLSGEEQRHKIHLMREANDNIHFHVWDQPAMREMFDYVSTRDDIGLRVVEEARNGSEVIWVLAKVDAAGFPAAKKGRANACLACGHPARRGDGQETQLNLAAPSPFRCERCGFLFVSPRNPQDFSAVPAEYYYHDWAALDGDSIAATAREIDWIARTLIDFENAAPRVLDVGCGGGALLAAMRVLGWRIQGVDPWRAATAPGRKYLRVPIDEATFEETNYPADAFDLVMAHDTLQFLADPRAFFAACQRIVRPGGLVHIVVPNAVSVEFREKGLRSSRYHPQTMLSYFSFSSLSELALRHGFVPACEGYHGDGAGDGFVRFTARKPMPAKLRWSDLAHAEPEKDQPWFDQSGVNEANLTPDQAIWRRDGVLIKEGLLPHDAIDRYCEVRAALNDPAGWPDGQPYLRHPEILDLCCHPQLAAVLQEVMQEPMGLHLNLTGWQTTGRAWHQDHYLNPPSVSGHYVAVWIALDEIAPHSGPFEFAPGTHRWPLIDRDRLIAHLGVDVNDPFWPWISEETLTPFFEQEILRQRPPLRRFYGRKGDVLIWHSRLLHRGSPAASGGAVRKGLIGHYSGLDRRDDFAGFKQRGPGGGHYFLEGAMESAMEAPPAPAPVPRRPPGLGEVMRGVFSRRQAPQQERP